MTSLSFRNHPSARLLTLVVFAVGVLGAGCGSASKAKGDDGGGGSSAGNSDDGGADLPQGAAGAGGAAGGSGQAGSGGHAGGGATGSGGMGGVGTAGNGASGKGGTGVGGSGGGSGDGGATTCADLAARAAALLDKDCTASDQCSVTTVYNCCTVYTGIRTDARSAFESAQADHMRSCPDLRGCQCQDHTETNELVPLHQPPLPVSATCELGKCTAHQK